MTVRIRRALPPPGATGRLLGLVRRRVPTPSSGGFSTKDVHVAFTVLSEGPDVGAGAAASGGGVWRGGGVGGEGGGDGGSGGWGGIAFAELEVERQSRQGSLGGEGGKIIALFISCVP